MQSRVQEVIWTSSVRPFHLRHPQSPTSAFDPLSPTPDFILWLRSPRWRENCESLNDSFEGNRSTRSDLFPVNAVLLHHDSKLASSNGIEVVMYDIEPLSCGSASRAYEVKNIGVGELASCKMSDCGSWKSLWFALAPSEPTLISTCLTYNKAVPPVSTIH